jgi:hypothetical protein
MQHPKRTLVTTQATPEQHPSNTCSSMQAPTAQAVFKVDDLQHPQHELRAPQPEERRGVGPLIPALVTRTGVKQWQQ